MDRPVQARIGDPGIRTIVCGGTADGNGLNRIAFVIPGIDRVGGAERQVLLLAEGLAQRNWQVSVIALSGSGGTASEELSSAGIGFLSLQMRKGLADPGGWRRFHGWLRTNKPEIVHAHLPHAAWFARWSRLFTHGYKVVDTIHTSAIGTKGRQIGYRFSDWLSDRVTAVSVGAMYAYVSAGMVSGEHITVLPNGVDTEVWRPDASMRGAVRQKLDLSNEFLWLAAGRLERVKDHATLFRAFAAIREPARLAIAGNGALESPLRYLAKELDIESRVHFLGFAADVRRWMQAADGFVQASLWEGLPMVLLEAAACALPAVGTNVSGTGEIIVDERTGLLAAPGDIGDIAAAMTRLMRMPIEIREAMGQRARQLVCERYSLECVLDRWERLYSELLLKQPVVPVWKQLYGA
jgi:glycosyltransferase involved in cell wall biosynthesis